MGFACGERSIQVVHQPLKFARIIGFERGLPPLFQRAEFSREPFVRGTCGMARSQHPDSGDSQFFIMFDEGSFLNGQYTVWGRVTSGMAFVDRIARGEPPRVPDRIIRLRVAADVKE